MRMNRLTVVALSLGLALTTPAHADVASQIAELERKHSAEISQMRIELERMNNFIIGNSVSPRALEASVESAVERRDGRIFQAVEEGLKRHSDQDGLEARLMAEIAAIRQANAAPAFDAEFAQRVNAAVRTSEARQSADMRALVGLELQRLKTELGVAPGVAATPDESAVLARVEQLEKDLALLASAKGRKGEKGASEVPGIVVDLSTRVSGIERSIESFMLSPAGAGDTFPPGLINGLSERLAALEARAHSFTAAEPARSPVGNPGIADLLGRMEQADGDIATMIELAGQLRGELEGVVSQINVAMETMSNDVRIVAESQGALEQRAATGYDTLAAELVAMVGRLDRVEAVLRIEN